MTDWVVREDAAVRRWLLCGELVAARVRGGLSVAELSAASGVTRAKLAEVERGAGHVSTDRVESILRACRASETQIIRLRALVPRPRTKPWWDSWRAVVPESFALYLGLECLATELVVHERSTVPALLRTQDYTRTVTEAALTIPRGDVETKVSLDIESARRVEDDASLRYRVVIGESALLRAPRDTSIMVRQFDHLMDISEHPPVDIRLLPHYGHLHPAMTVPEHTLFGLSSVGHSEAFEQSTYVRDPDGLRRYRTAAEQLTEAALSPAETRDALLRLRKRL